MTSRPSVVLVGGGFAGRTGGLGLNLLSRPIAAQLGPVTPAAARLEREAAG